MKKESQKVTMLVISMGFLALSLIFSVRWAAIVALIVGVSGAFSDYLSSKIEWFWLKLGNLIGYVMSTIILCLVFYLVLFPISLLSRLSRKDPLMLLKKYDSYFINSKAETGKDRFEKTW